MASKRMNKESVMLWGMKSTFKNQQYLYIPKTIYPLNIKNTIPFIIAEKYLEANLTKTSI